MTDIHAPIDQRADARVTHSVIPVDASIAARWLTRNTKNRSIRQQVVQRYRTDMAEGRWSFAGDPIRFDMHGNLIDGQHRLTALADLDDVTIPMLVIRGLPPEMQAVMDQGARRTPGDQLGMKGIKHANLIGAGVKQYLIWTEGYLFRDTKVTQGQITTPAIEEWVDSHPVLSQQIQDFASIVRQNDAPPSVAVAAALRFMQIDRDATEEFFTLLARGAGTEGHPILTLDKRLQRQRRQGLKMSHRDYLSLFILAWNAWREGRQMAKFQRPRGGYWDEDNFPEPH